MTSNLSKISENNDSIKFIVNVNTKLGHYIGIDIYNNNKF